MSRCSATALAAWAAPEKRWYQAVSKGLVTFVWLSRRRCQSATGSRLGRFSHLLLHRVAQRRRPIIELVVLQTARWLTVYGGSRGAPFASTIGQLTGM
jgi:hypothetical protein